MHDISITSDEVLNSLAYRTPFCVIMLQTVKYGQIFSWLKLNGILAQYRFSKPMPRIFKYGDIPNISFTPGKDLNIFIYRSPS